MHICIVGSIYSSRFSYVPLPSIPFFTLLPIFHSISPFLLHYFPLLTYVTAFCHPSLGVFPSCHLWLLTFMGIPNGTHIKVKDSTLLTKIPHTWIVEHRDIKLGTSLEASSQLATFHSARKCFAHNWQSKVYPSYPAVSLWAAVMISLTRHTHWSNCGINVTGVASCIVPLHSSIAGTVIRAKI